MSSKHRMFSVIGTSLTSMNFYFQLLQNFKQSIGLYNIGQEKSKVGVLTESIGAPSPCASCAWGPLNPVQGNMITARLELAAGQHLLWDCGGRTTVFQSQAISSDKKQIREEEEEGHRSDMEEKCPLQPLSQFQINKWRCVSWLKLWCFSANLACHCAGTAD